MRREMASVGAAGASEMRRRTQVVALHESTAGAPELCLRRSRAVWGASSRGQSDGGSVTVADRICNQIFMPRRSVRGHCRAVYTSAAAVSLTDACGRASCAVFPRPQRFAGKVRAGLMRGYGSPSLRAALLANSAAMQTRDLPGMSASS